MNLTEAAALLDEIAEEQCRIYKVGSQFRARSQNPDDPVVRTTDLALGYPLRGSHDGAANTRRPAHQTFTMGDDVLAAWEELATLIGSSMIAARLHDLLWSEKFGDQPHEHARAAIQHYISATSHPRCEGIEVVSYLERAYDLSREIKVPEVGRPVGRRASEELVAEYECHQTKSRPGVVLRLLRLLLSLDESDRPADLRVYFDEANRLFSEREPRNRAEILQLQEALASTEPGEKSRLQRARVDLWVQHAERQEDGLLRIDALRQALEVADETGQPADIRNNIRRMIEQIDPDDLYTESFKTSTEVPSEMIEGFIDHIVGNDGIGPALDRFGAWWPPTGDPAEVAAFVDELRERFVFWSHFSQVVFDDEGRPLHYAETDKETRDLAVVKHEVLVARTHAAFAQTVLDRIGAKYAPDQEELRALFQTELITHQQPDAFARALKHYWAGRFDESIHTALPRIEPILRQALAAAGGVTYEEPQGDQPGAAKTLGKLLRDSSHCMPEELLHPLRVLLTNPLGLNLRNRYLHGIVTHAPDAQALQQDAVLVLWIAAHLRLLRLKPSTDSPAEED